MDQVSGPLGYRLAKALLSHPLHRAYDIEVDGIGRLPGGPAILAANHRSFMDSVFLAAVVDRPVSFMAKAEYFDRRRTAWIFRSTGQIPLRRGSPAGARRALNAALGVLSQGGVVGVYPEGTRSRDGRLHRGHLGPARLAAVSGAPIVPVGLIGTDAIQAPDQRLPRVGKRVTVRFGSPLRVDPQEASHRAHLRDVTDQMMADIAMLCGQQYADRYAELVVA
jgi:1-acyl-sn-glycerol-3-phosphate acyltransferase